MRAFVAAFLTEPSARRLEAVAHECLDAHLDGGRGHRWVPPGNYHVTLKFLGEVETDVLRDARDAVGALAGHGVSVRASGFVGLPRSARARLAALVLDREAHLERWWTDLQRRLGAETRGFRPHVTVLRLRGSRPLTPVPLPEPLALDLEAPRLYRSDSGPDGSIYSPLG
ncbi:MAG TPA: RNA 2',3'-cyclic phosphodiesterase [Pseudomonadales bacterium]